MSLPESAAQGIERGKPVKLSLALSNMSVVDEAKMEVAAEFLPEGPGNPDDKHYYTREAVISCVAAFEGAQCYINHPTITEEEELPERSMHSLIGYWHDIQALNGGEVAKGVLNLANTTVGRDAFAQLKHAIEYQKRYPNSEKPYCGPSILAGGDAKEGDYRGETWFFVTKITKGTIDLVTRTGTKGKFTEIMESLRESERNNNSKGVNRMKKKALKDIMEACSAGMKKAKEGDMSGLEEAFGKLGKLHDGLKDEEEDPKEESKKEESAKEESAKKESAKEESTKEESVKESSKATDEIMAAKLKESEVSGTATIEQENAMLKRKVSLLESEKIAKTMLKESGLPANACDRLFRQMLDQPEETMKIIVGEEKAYRESLISEVVGTFRESYPAGPQRDMTAGTPDFTLDCTRKE